jgi:hypothetical protein
LTAKNRRALKIFNALLFILKRFPDVLNAYSRRFKKRRKGDEEKRSELI